MTTIVNLFGGPGCGKSTIAAGLFYKMKLAGYSVELVTEYARDLVYSNRHDVLTDQQEYIFAEQNYRIHRLRDKVDWVITDSPILLSYVYPEINQEQNGAKEWPALPQFKAFVFAEFQTYDNLNVLLHRPVEGYSKDGRTQDLEQAKKIDGVLVDLLKETNVHYIELTSNDGVIERLFKYVTEFDHS